MWMERHYHRKHKLNEFYKKKYGGLGITNIMEGEIATVKGKAITLEEMVTKCGE